MGRVKNGTTFPTHTTPMIWETSGGRESGPKNVNDNVKLVANSANILLTLLNYEFDNSFVCIFVNYPKNFAFAQAYPSIRWRA
mmetsp:Transcript_19270/g.35990  ORF Transcript_19270/g.35990 Transcript_19270/m.35990 type:complete len:83 (+) Transcript_19270:511-759(+)